MDENSLKIQMMEKYYFGQMSEGEKIVFEKELASDSGLASDYQNFCDAQLLIVDQALLNFQDSVRDFSGKHRKQLFRRSTLRIGLYFVAAAAAVIGVYVITNQNDPRQVPNSDTLGISTTLIQETVADTIVQTDLVNRDVFVNVTNVSADQKTSNAEENGELVKTADKKQNSDSTADQTGNRNLKVSNAVTNPVAANEQHASPCTQRIIRADITIKKSCAEKPNGLITVLKSTISGGRAPYRFSVDDSYFSANYEFHDLAAGSYTITVKDADGCISRLPKAEVGSVFCDNEFVFSPSRNETWTIPMHGYSSAELSIFSKSNQLVFARTIQQIDPYSWEGIDNSGNRLPMALYRFTIKYDNGEVFSGYITIVE